MQVTKIFIFAYVFMLIIISLLGIEYSVILENIPTSSNPVLNILFWFPNLIITIFNILTFSVLDSPITNMILWAIRFIAYIEIALAIRGNS